jgi:hypothetical protein
MVWACHTPRWVAQTLQQMNGFRAETAKEVGESREQNKASALRPTNATEIFQLLVTDLADAPDLCRSVAAKVGILMSTAQSRNAVMLPSQRENNRPTSMASRTVIDPAL